MAAAGLSLKELAQGRSQYLPASLYPNMHSVSGFLVPSLQGRVLIIVLFFFFGKCYSALLPAASNLLLTSLQSPWQ